MPQTLRVKVKGKWYTVEVGSLLERPVRALVDGEPFEIDIETTPPAPEADAPDTAESAPEPEPTGRPDNPPIEIRRLPTPVREFRSPMPGVIISIDVKEGDEVIVGDQICVLESMKMRQVLRADWSGVVRQIHVTPGQQVMDGNLIAELE